MVDAHDQGGREPSLASRYRALYGGVVYDALCHDIRCTRPFVLDRHIGPLYKTDDPVLFGHTFTCRGQKVLRESDVDDSVRLRMFQDFSVGCVQVIQADPHDSCALFGDISGRLAKKFGSVGAVVDGDVRDLRLLEQDAFPLYARGAQPIDAYGRWQIAAYQVPIEVRGIDGPVTVEPNDYVFADDDGVIVIPARFVEDVAELATARLERERDIRARLDSYEDVQRLHDDIGRW
jgi:4-hydroxy-4-methyl-2-oxoglutarate aldolase